MSDNLPPLPEFEKWLRSVCFQAPPAHAYDLARCAWVEADKNATTDVEAMAEEIERLQKALAFWMPDVPPTDHPLYKRVANDVYLLVGCDGPTTEPSAFELGHVSLSGIEADLVSRDVPAGWKLVPVKPTPEMNDAANYAYDEWGWNSASKMYAAMLAASPQPQPVQGGDATDSVNETNAVLASRYFDLLKVVESYEAHGVTCQTFRHFVDQPCDECNCTTQPVQAQPSKAATDVLAERQRQISAEGWTPEHDDEHDNGSMATAAACYADHKNNGAIPIWWPWAKCWWKSKDRRSDLVKAGALVLAEIERLDRAEQAQKEE